MPNQSTPEIDGRAPEAVIAQALAVRRYIPAPRGSQWASDIALARHIMRELEAADIPGWCGSDPAVAALRRGAAIGDRMALLIEGATVSSQRGVADGLMRECEDWRRSLEPRLMIGVEPTPARGRVIKRKGSR